jgi:superfamily I DNA and/or RNA helicase
MNLYHLNTGVDSIVLQNAEYDIRRYTDFISNAIKFLEKEALSIKVKKHIAETETIINGEKKITKETRYIPEPPKNKREEKAIEILFNESTRNIFDQNKDFKSGSIRIIDQNEDENYIVLAEDIKGDTIYFKPDTYQLEQQKRALDNLRHRPLKEHYPLLNLFGFPDSQVWSQRFYRQDFDWTILTDETKDGVHEQREFVSKAIQTKDFALMEGPPGSGKTTTIIELIMQFAKQGKRILLCSATHAAIDNVIERIKGRYKDICDKEIIPVRISRFEKPVKESVRPYLLKNLVNTYKSEIENHLKKNNTLESQKFLLENINSNSEQDPIEKIILDSANLVAGTMIGILQHPDIRANKQGASFDVLIVDESSKVTFPDFIVPALHAKKWILVGDVKQLSPYVENDYVSENIAILLDKELQRTIVQQFELKSKLDDKRFDDCLKVYFTDNNPHKEKETIKKDFVVATVDPIWEPTRDNVIFINTADVVIAKNDNRVRQILANQIFVKSIFINGETTTQLQTYRQAFFRKLEKKEMPYLFDSRQEDWAEMVSSRLNQSFSFRNAGEEFSNIDKELEYLLPDETIKNKVMEIKRLVFPSILEMLQNGVGKGTRQRNDRVISDGFSDFHKQSRFVSLSYQHRMHPDIAKTSRENFYENNLLPANTVLGNREWNYALNEPVVKWIHNNDKTGNIKGNKIINPTEVNDIEKELLKFLDWAKNNPKPNGEHYEVAVLTFYLNQESELRKRIRKITKQSNFSKFHKDNTDIFLYTVDKFQGQEADMVLLSFTKFTRDAHYNSPNRLNVALTRARFKLVLFGNKEWFKKYAKLKALRDLATNFESIIHYEK